MRNPLSQLRMGNAVAALDGAMQIASSPQGQMATAVVVVLLAWAVLTKRVFVICWREEVVVPKEKESIELPTKVQEKIVEPVEVKIEEEHRPRLSRRSTSLDGRTSLTAEEVHVAAGTPIRNANGKLSVRPGAYWSEPDASGFRVRGPTYLMDKVKVGSPEPVFHLLDCDLFDLPAPTPHLVRHLKPRIDALWKEQNMKGYTFVVQLQVPGPPHKSFVMYFGCARREEVFEGDTPFSRTARRFFVEEDTTPTSGNQTLHKWRNNTFKLIPRCVNAPFVVKRAVGEVPTLLGNKLQQSYFGRRDYFEVDVNISSSRIAQYTVGLALNYASVVICDLAFVLQGATPAELPEVIAGCMRIEHISMKDATNFNLNSNNGDAPSP